MDLEIVVTKRAHDYHACLKNNKAIWESGKSSNEAIAKLLITNQKTFKIKVSHQDSPNKN